MSDNRLDKKAKEIILSHIENLNEITTDRVMELIKPHFTVDSKQAMENELRKKANSLIAGIKDGSGVRLFFNCKNEDGKSKYVNIDTTKNLKDLHKIDKQISTKYYGLNRSKAKVDRRKQEIYEQLSISALDK